ncbi:MAG: hypothetical protein HDR11_06775 [Lachnospiraceae bacterium]|nr:hypothetical protein [Lachnospiraceae bacterium]
MSIMEDLAVRVGDAGKDVLSQAIRDAEGMILDVCNRTSLPPLMANLQLSLAEIYARRIMAAGEASRSEGDVSVSWAYSKEIPDDLMERIKARRLIKQAVIANETKK